ncbi:carbohydrate kinase [Leifsonia shinshuensis]|uniref:carbohydrate kinase family protein n=1 Tax=Leifsonia shinshuensis TaxID=150026 RepID=UPI001F50BFE7|nr:carbohydrate kinase [Leifsonia shinshuensis]MCI0157754.1 carbohydrate kinase [Leifsonia shinshuensis]
MTAERSVLVVGEALTDIIDRGGVVEEVPGGSPANVALGLGRLGTPTALLTALGRDARGRAIADRLDTADVAVLEQSWSLEETSTAAATLNPDGSAEYRFRILWRLPDTVEVSAASHLHVGSIATFLAPGADQVTAVVESRGAGTTVSYDPNIRRDLVGDPVAARSRFEQLCRSCDIVKLSDEDAEFLFPELTPEGAAQLIGDVVPIVVVTRGAEGSLLRHGGVTTPVPVTMTTVADTVGAGDSYMAALLWALLREPAWPAVEPDAVLRAATIASRAASITVSRVGAEPPTTAALLR